LFRGLSSIADQAVLAWDLCEFDLKTG